MNKHFFFLFLPNIYLDFGLEGIYVETSSLKNMPDGWNGNGKGAQEKWNNNEIIF